MHFPGLDAKVESYVSDAGEIFKVFGAVHNMLICKK